MAEEKKPESAESTAPRRDFGKILKMAFVVFNLSFMLGGAFVVYSVTLGYTPKSVTEDQLSRELSEFRKTLQKGPVMYSMDVFNTNLDGVPRRLIRMNLNLEMLDEEGFEEVMTLGAESRDSIMRILNGKTFDQVETVQGKLQLKTQIIAQINSFLERGVVKNVYFTDFVVQ